MHDSHLSYVGILEDLQGQVIEAVSTSQYYEKWGKHYLRSLGRSHQHQLCSNFKDPGIQFYGGELFKKIRYYFNSSSFLYAVSYLFVFFIFSTSRDQMEAIYTSLPPPTPSNPNRRAVWNGASVSMSMFHNSSNPCFDGECTILMHDLTQKKVTVCSLSNVCCYLVIGFRICVRVIFWLLLVVNMQSWSALWKRNAKATKQNS